MGPATHAAAVPDTRTTRHSLPPSAPRNCLQQLYDMRCHHPALLLQATEKPRCGVCHRVMERFILTCSHCSTDYHTDCLAQALLQQQQELPSLRPSSCSSLPGIGSCLSCGGRLVWQDLLEGMKSFGVAATASQRQPRSRTRNKKGSKARWV